jgi:hypothetical protein
VRDSFERHCDGCCAGQYEFERPRGSERLPGDKGLPLSTANWGVERLEAPKRLSTACSARLAAPSCFTSSSAQPGPLTPSRRSYVCIPQSSRCASWGTRS